MTQSFRMAVPVENGQGLEAVRSEHFGHASKFAIVDIVDGAVTGPVTTLVNPPHVEGGCGSIVQTLVSNGVQVVSAAGMGRGPLNGLLANGVEVHYDPESRTVDSAVKAILKGETRQFVAQQACQGHH